MAQRLALFIGVGRYLSPAYAGRQPSCCCGDAHAFAETLRENAPRTASPNFRLLGGQVYATPDPFDPADPEVTAAALTARVRDLFTMVRRGDALLYFTGHAIPVPMRDADARGGDDGARDGVDSRAAGGRGTRDDAGSSAGGSSTGGSDLLLLTADDEPGPDGVRRGIRMSDVCRAAWASQANSITIILDCCYSGVAATMAWPRNTTVLASTDEFTASQSLSGTHLLYTSALMAALQGAAADVQGVVTPLSLHSTVCALLDLGEDGQQPVLSTWSDAMVPLRHVEASRQITEEELARIAPAPDGAAMGSGGTAHAGGTTRRGRRGAPTRSFDGVPLPPFTGFPAADAAFLVHPEHEAPGARDGVMRDGSESWEQLDGLQRDMELFKHLRNAKLLQAFIREPDGMVHEADLFWACMAEWDAESHAPTGRQGFVRLTDLGRLYWQVQHKR